VKLAVLFLCLGNTQSSRSEDPTGRQDACLADPLFRPQKTYVLFSALIQACSVVLWLLQGWNTDDNNDFSWVFFVLFYKAVW